MTIVSVLPPFILIILYLFISHLIIKYIPFFKTLIDFRINSTTIHLPIEGLRGFLALSVFFCHSIVSNFLFKTHQWDVPPSRFYSFLGPLESYYFFTSLVIFFGLGVLIQIII